jgi:hypothetical protein
LDDDRIRALIIGVSEYEMLPDLAMVGADAKGFAEALEQPRVGADQVTRLDSPSASMALAEITQQLRAARRGGTLLIYFAGYGIRVGDALFLCARDTNPRDPWGTAIPVNRLRREIDGGRLRHVMVIVDSRTAGTHAEEAPLDGLRGETYTLLASTNSRPVLVVDAPGTTRMASAFTRALIDGLWRGEADYDNSGVVSLDELREFVRSRMLEASGSDPVVYMAAGPSNLRLAQSGRLTLLVHEDPPPAETEMAFRQITSHIDLKPAATGSGRTAWRAFAKGFLEIFGMHRARPARRPSAWERLSGRLTDKYEELGTPPHPRPEDDGRSRP